MNYVAILFVFFALLSELASFPITGILIAAALVLFVMDIMKLTGQPEQVKSK